MRNNRISENLKHKDTDVLYINISYPQIDIASKSEKKFNLFYSMQALEYRAFAVNKLYPLAKNMLDNKEDFLKLGASITNTVTFENKYFISVLSVITFFDGKNTVSTQRTAVWDRENGFILKFKDLYNYSKKCKNTIYSKVTDIYVDMVHSGRFEEVFTDSEKNIKKYFDFDNFCLTPKGIAFYLGCKKILHSQSNKNAFVVPYYILSEYCKIPEKNLIHSDDD